MCVLEIVPELISNLYNSILNFVFGDFGGLRFAEFQQRVRIVGLYIKVKTCSRSQKIIQNNYLTEVRFISLKSQQKCFNPIRHGGGGGGGGHDVLKCIGGRG